MSMSDVVKAILIRILAVISLAFIALLCARSEASEFHLVDVDQLNIDYKNFKMIYAKAREPLVWPEYPKEGLDLNLNLSLVGGYGYVESSVQALTVESQYRNVGLVLHAGVHLSPLLDVGFYHHSAHVLDEKQPYMPFLSEDAVEVRLNLINDNHKKGVF